jgi:hypothetical protein
VTTSGVTRLTVLTAVSVAVTPTGDTTEPPANRLCHACLDGQHPVPGTDGVLDGPGAGS